MNLDTAIEILELNVKQAGKKMPADTLDALKLGIEALKRIIVFHDDDELLPGETPQGETPEGESP